MLRPLVLSTKVNEPRSGHLSPKHVTIYVGGELGYALSVAFGAITDNPDLIVPVVIGDGEAETGPTATYDKFFSCRKKDVPSSLIF